MTTAQKLEALSKTIQSTATKDGQAYQQLSILHFSGMLTVRDCEAIAALHQKYCGSKR